MNTVTLARPAPLFSSLYHLPAPFTRCPVCGGTTSMGDHYENGVRCICSVCYSCDTRWDLQGNCIHYGAVVHLPLVNNLTLTEDDAKYNPAIRRGRLPGEGRHSGQRDKKTRNLKRKGY